MKTESIDPVFYELFQKLVSEMTVIDRPKSDPKIEELLVEICKVLRVCKAVTRLYRNSREELEGGGETLCSRDTGEKCHEIHHVRVVTNVLSVATLTTYIADDQPPLTDEEFYCIDLVMRTTVSFLSRNRLTDMVEELAYYDDQGYRNVRLFMAETMKMAGSGKINGMAAINYNLRHFTLVNQQFGKSVGDDVLRNHFTMFEQLIGESGLVCRLGGDNFLSLFDKRKLNDVLNFVTEAKVPFECSGGGTVTIHCSAGVYVVGENDRINEPGDILAKIITAFRVAQNGNVRIVFYNDDLIRKKQAAMRVQELFPLALKNEEFQVYYQPKVNILTGEVYGAEALCRWIKDGRVVPPFEFIPILEQTNDICKLDFYMLEHVCRDIRRWLDEGRKVVRISVNMSRRHMTDETLLDTILGIINWYSIPHELIEIELTETTTDVGFTDLKRVVSGLSEADICTSIDDFGMGYSSLNLLRGIPWKVLKVDRSFVPESEGESDKVRSIMFKYVVGMAKDIGLECVVEGVETEEHLGILRENGCEYAQGYLFDKPLPVEEFETRLADGFIYDVDR